MIEYQNYITSFKSIEDALLKKYDCSIDIENQIDKELKDIDLLLKIEPELKCKNKTFWRRYDLLNVIDLQGDTLMHNYQLHLANQDKFSKHRELICKILEQKCLCKIKEVDI